MGRLGDLGVNIHFLEVKMVGNLKNHFDPGDKKQIMHSQNNMVFTVKQIYYCYACERGLGKGGDFKY